MRKTFVLSAVLLLWSVPVFACSATKYSNGLIGYSAIGEISQYSERTFSVLASQSNMFPIARGEYCTFAFARRDDTGFGTVTVDLDGGWVSQTFRIGDGCSTQEYMSISNCKSGEFVILEGSGPIHMVDNQIVEIDNANLVGHHLAPEGAIDLWNDVSIENLVKSANSADLDVTLPSALKKFEAAHFDGDEVRPLCGCKIYYSDSLGAKS